ncbi:universal stress protein [Roseovarius sp. EGI FJ00037]|uniref:universal stress protein n=2 Tax=Roseovarius TaxID=74030 RepID=UPI0022A7DEC9|nr:universal stress protein [Roseovarius sp. EGI FJ00037]MCZ0811410.1 universal stress protein [Roseovarius sp. EGI FJ00037]
MEMILVATDFSERSDRALRRATLLARQFEAKLHVVHVVDDDQPKRVVDAEYDQGSKLLRLLAETLRDVDGVDCETRVILASPFAGIVRAAEELEPDLLVIGPHRRQVLRDVFIGTTAERTIRSVTCPVLMVNATPAARYRHVLQTTDLSDGSRDALRRLPALGITEQAKNSLLYVFDAPALRLTFSGSMPRDDQQNNLDDEKRDAARDLAKFVVSSGLGGCHQVVRYESTAPQHEILKSAKAEKADLIVLSTHGRSGVGKLMIGSVTEQVLRSSTVDVLAIPPLRSR